MDSFFDQLAGDDLAVFTMQTLLDGAMRHVYVFSLVLVRMSGLMIIGPIFGQPIVPPNIRVMLVFVLALMITPVLLGETSAAIPPTLLNYAWIIAGELSLGFALGLGMFIILSGLQLAGQLIDQQAGISLGEVISPGLDSNSSLSGQSLYFLGVAALLLLEPIGGHLLLISALVETFQTFPVGDAFLSVSAISVVRDLVHQSLVLGVQVAAPLLAAMSVVAVTMGFLGHTVPQVNVLVVGFPIRAMISLFILMLTFSGAARAVVDLVPTVIDSLYDALTTL